MLAVADRVGPWPTLVAVAVAVVATGLGAGAASRVSEPSTLHPAAPRRLTEGVLLAALGSPRPVGPLDRLLPHPPAARTRRLRRASAVIVLLLAVVAVAQLLWWFTGFWAALLGLLAVVAVAGTVALALDSARSLGHRLDPGHLSTRHGTLRRATTVVHRDGVIGWRTRQSVFQRSALPGWNLDRLNKR